MTPKELEVTLQVDQKHRSMSIGCIKALLSKDQAKIKQQLVQIGQAHTPQPPFGHRLYHGVHIVVSLNDCHPSHTALPMGKEKAQQWQDQARNSHFDKKWQLPKFTLTENGSQGMMFADAKAAFLISNASQDRATFELDFDYYANVVKRWESINRHWKLLANLLRSYWMYNPHISNEEVW